MGLRSFIKNTAKTNTNVKGWASWGEIKQNAQVVGTFMDTFKKRNQTAQPETFEEAVKRLSLSEQDINARMKSYFRVAALCAILGFAALGWTFYLLLFRAMFLSSLVGLGLAGLMFTYAFREHFYYFQMKNRRLNCTVKEWFSSLLHREVK